MIKAWMLAIATLIIVASLPLVLTAAAGLSADHGTIVVPFIMSLFAGWLVYLWAE